MEYFAILVWIVVPLLLALGMARRRKIDDLTACWVVVLFGWFGLLWIWSRPLPRVRRSTLKRSGTGAAGRRAYRR